MPDVLLLLSACAPISLGGDALTELGAWSLVGRDEDPLAAHRPDPVDCPGDAWGGEIGVLEVRTGSCNYFAASQPTLAKLRAGRRLIGTVWYDGLDAEEPAEAHVAVLLGETVVWERFLPVPSPGDVHQVDVEVLEDQSEGTPLGLHLHNHGSNSWRFDEWTGR